MFLSSCVPKIPDFEGAFSLFLESLCKKFLLFGDSEMIIGHTGEKQLSSLNESMVDVSLRLRANDYCFIHSRVVIP